MCNTDVTVYVVCTAASSCQFGSPSPSLGNQNPVSGDNYGCSAVMLPSGLGVFVASSLIVANGTASGGLVYPFGCTVASDGSSISCAFAGYPDNLAIWPGPCGFG